MPSTHARGRRPIAPGGRILISSCPLFGHVNTLLPLALAAQRAGHEVVVATGPDLVPHVERSGLAAWPVGPTHAEAGGSAVTQWVEYFIDSAGKRAVELVPRAVSWAPDLLLHEETELAGAVAAQATGARHAVHGLGLMPPIPIWDALAPAFEQLFRQWDVPGSPQAIRDADYLDVCPQALQPGGEPIWQHVLPLRPSFGQPSPDHRLPAAMAGLPYRRTAHLTLGTVFHRATEVLETAIDGLRDLPINLVVTTGPGSDPSRFGPQPAHVLIEPYLPHGLLLPRCCLVVSQGGAGIMFGALAHGLPQLVLPQGADQYLNADACMRAGAGLCLVGEDVTAACVTAAAQRLLGEPRFAEAAAAVQAEIERRPTPDQAFATLTDRSRRP
jgi:UDP:flavonoid glycosyltransferase YjiC (YdhE family)